LDVTISDEGWFGGENLLGDLFDIFDGDVVDLLTEGVPADGLATSNDESLGQFDSFVDCGIVIVKIGDQLFLGRLDLLAGDVLERMDLVQDHVDDISDISFGLGIDRKETGVAVRCVERRCSTDAFDFLDEISVEKRSFS